MPKRMCIACRKKGPPEMFFRMVAGPGDEVYVELDSKLPGRGAYCCIGRGCMESALDPKVLGRAFRKEVIVPKAQAVADSLRNLLMARMEGLWGAASRKKTVSAGHDAALRAIRSGKSEKGGRIFLAADLSSGSRADFEAAGPRPPVEMKMTMERLGEIFGGRPVGVAYVSDFSLADSLALRNSQAVALGDE